MIPILLIGPTDLLRANDDERITIDARDSELEARTGITRLIGDVVITRGPMEVRADHGVVVYADNRLTEVELTGDPCTWKDRLEDGTEIFGEAQTIEFDIASNTVRFSGNAYVRHPQGDITGDVLTYNLDTETLSGTRTRHVIEPAAGRRLPGGNGSTDADSPRTPGEGED